MTVAADDGVMPQTREHARVLRGLGVRDGVVAVTKCDAADPARALAEAARADARGARPCAVSARTGDGLDELRAALDRVAAAAARRAERRRRGRAAAARGPLLHDHGGGHGGHGHAVVGPRRARRPRGACCPAGLRCRVRTVHVHDHEVERAAAGQRVALNLVGVSRDEVARGDVVSSAGHLQGAPHDRRWPTWTWRRRSSDGERVQVHHGTRESPARVSRRRRGGGCGCAWSGRCWRRPATGWWCGGSRRPETLGGGVVLDAAPGRRAPAPAGAPAAGAARRRPRSPPAALELEQRLLAAGPEPPLDSELAGLERRAGRTCAPPAAPCGWVRGFTSTPRALDEVRRAARGHLAEHASITIARAARRAGHQPQVRPGAARALRRRGPDAAQRRRARAAPAPPRAGRVAP